MTSSTLKKTRLLRLQASPDDLGADSLDVVDLVMSFEEEFDIEIPDDQVEKIKTVGDIVKFIEEKVED